VTSDIRIGTSGWNYPGGRGTWNGVFYPARRPRGFDELSYYAEHFDTVEVNSTFYRAPDPALVSRWLARTPPEFLFSVKLYQKFTHPDMYLARNGVADWSLSAGDFDEFRRGVDPLAHAGRLGALLVQFPSSFHDEPATRDYLAWLLAGLSDYPLAVELRHRTWRDSPDTSGLLASHHASFAVVDEPTHQFAAPAAGSAPVYIRLHGRNTDAWWDHAEAEDRYNYLYSAAELAPVARAAKTAGASGRRVFMYLNNHFSAKAVANAAILRHELGQPVEGEYEREMVSRYPELEGRVRTSGLPL
jgi:uncharacterized protein YecE (DUF72 family)